MGLFNRIRPDPGFVSPVRSDPGFVSPIQSDPIRSDPGFVNGQGQQSQYKKPEGHSLIWPKQVCAAQQGMVFRVLCL